MEVYTSISVTLPIHTLLFCRSSRLSSTYFGWDRSVGDLHSPSLTQSREKRRVGALLPCSCSHPRFWLKIASCNSGRSTRLNILTLIIFSQRQILCPLVPDAQYLFVHGDFLGRRITEHSSARTSGIMARFGLSISRKVVSKARSPSGTPCFV
jgi:hypothetical protein